MRAALVLALTAAALAGCTQPPQDQPTPQQYARQLFEGVNEQRTAQGLTELQWQDCLADKALPRAQLAATDDALEHELLVATCLPGQAAGENLSRGAFTAQEIVDMWMASAGHRANIERPGFTIAGVGCIEMPDADAGFSCSLLFEGGD